MFFPDCHEQDLARWPDWPQCRHSPRFIWCEYSRIVNLPSRLRILLPKKDDSSEVHV